MSLPITTPHQTSPPPERPTRLKTENRKQKHKPQKQNKNDQNSPQNNPHTQPQILSNRRRRNDERTVQEGIHARDDGHAGDYDDGSCFCFCFRCFGSGG